MVADAGERCETASVADTACSLEISESVEAGPTSCSSNCDIVQAVNMTAALQKFGFRRGRPKMGDFSGQLRNSVGRWFDEVGTNDHA
jgi:hypothetical protein